ncbi:MAG TPA: DUF6526 family protein [Edaphobacter sp.]|jgi:hypothetical protein|nr:DUF6526 family protein [Edaphobacter sp.]
MPALQSYKNHGRMDPPIHFFVFPVLIINFFVTIFIAIQHWSHHRSLHLWWIVVSAALLILAFKTRVNDLKVQDRVIRLEETLRLASLLSPADLAQIQELDTRQIIALRFASDAELPALVHKTLTQGLEPKAIKQNIINWRADNHRV